MLVGPARRGAPRPVASRRVRWLRKCVDDVVVDRPRPMRPARPPRRRPGAGSVRSAGTSAGRPCGGPWVSSTTARRRRPARPRSAQRGALPVGGVAAGQRGRSASSLDLVVVAQLLQVRTQPLAAALGPPARPGPAGGARLSSSSVAGQPAAGRPPHRGPVDRGGDGTNGSPRRCRARRPRTRPRNSPAIRIASSTIGHASQTRSSSVGHVRRGPDVEVGHLAVGDARRC